METILLEYYAQMVFVLIKFYHVLGIATSIKSPINVGVKLGKIATNFTYTLYQGFCNFFSFQGTFCTALNYLYIHVDVHGRKAIKP